MHAPDFEKADRSAIARGLVLKRSVTGLALVGLLVFILSGILLIPLLGLQDDELIFVNIFQHPNDCFSRLPLFGAHAIPGMASSYLGALKSWIYSLLLFIAAPTIWVVRLPALFLAALTIILTGQLMKQIAGPIASSVVILLLATDATFLFTATFDWGPVVIQNLLLVISLLLLAQWYRKRTPRWLFLGGLAIGLALWDKALFVWQLTGLAIAFLLICFSIVKEIWNRRNLWLFTRGVLLGALPLLIANFRHHFATIKDNGHMTVAALGPKAAFLRSALDGRAATTFFVESGNNSIDQIYRPFEAAGLALVRSLGHAPSLWRFYPAIVIIFLGIYLARGSQRKWMLFFLISGAIAWFQSATTQNAGEGVHQVVLLWVNWYSALSLGFTSLLKSSVSYLRIGAAFITGLLCIRGILVIGAGYGELISHPPTSRWTNADMALADRLLKMGIKRTVVADWGITNVIRARTNDAITVDYQGVKLFLRSFDANAFQNCTTADCVVIAHAPGRNIWAFAPDTLKEGLAKTGLVKSGCTLISDTHGVPAFEVFHLSREKKPLAELRERPSLARNLAIP